MSKNSHHERRRAGCDKVYTAKSGTRQIAKYLVRKPRLMRIAPATNDTGRCRSKPCSQKTTAQTQKQSMSVSHMTYVLEMTKSGLKSIVNPANNGRNPNR